MGCRSIERICAAQELPCTQPQRLPHEMFIVRIEAKASVRPENLRGLPTSNRVSQPPGHRARDFEHDELRPINEQATI